MAGQEYSYSQAKSPEDLKKAKSLVVSAYKKQGYIGEGDDSKIFQHVENGKSSVTFMAWHKDETLGTISIVSDGENGLPMDLLYKKELENFRGAKNKIAEVVQFAVDKNAAAGFSISFNLMKLVFRHAIREDLDYLCITVNPKHVSFYASIGFEQFGDLAYYPSVNNAPAIALSFDVQKIKSSIEKGESLSGLLAELAGE